MSELDDAKQTIESLRRLLEQERGTKAVRMSKETRDLIRDLRAENARQREALDRLHAERAAAWMRPRRPAPPSIDPDAEGYERRRDDAYHDPRPSELEAELRPDGW